MLYKDIEFWLEQKDWSKKTKKLNKTKKLRENCQRSDQTFQLCKFCYKNVHKTEFSIINKKKRK